MDEDNERSVSSQIIRLSSVFFAPTHTQREHENSIDNHRDSNTLSYCCKVRELTVWPPCSHGNYFYITHILLQLYCAWSSLDRIPCYRWYKEEVVNMATLKTVHHNTWLSSLHFITSAVGADQLHVCCYCPTCAAHYCKDLQVCTDHDVVC